MNTSSITSTTVQATATHQTKKQLSFIPDNYERDDPTLTKLFKDVEALISNYMEHEALDNDEDKIRCYVAGHVCHEMIDELKGKMVAFSPLKKVYPWNIYVREELNKLNSIREGDGKVSFKDKEVMTKIKEDYDAIMEIDSVEKARLVAQANHESQDLRKVEMSMKFKHFKNDWETMRDNFQYFYENYRTHIIAITSTDTKFDGYYSPKIATNSEISRHALGAIHDEIPGMTLLGILNSTVSNEGVFAASERKGGRKGGKKRRATTLLEPAPPPLSPTPTPVSHAPALVLSSPSPAPASPSPPPLSPTPAPLSPAPEQPVSEQPTPTPARATRAASSDEYDDDGNDDEDEDEFYGRSSTRRRLRSSATATATATAPASAPTPTPTPTSAPATAPVTAPVVRSSEASNFVASFNGLFPSKKPKYKNRKDDYLKVIRAKAEESYRSVVSPNPRTKTYRKVEWTGVFINPEQCSVSLKGWPESVPPPFGPGNSSIDIKALDINNAEIIAKGFEDGTIRFEKNVTAEQSVTSEQTND
ncbi:hypothetical protein HMPREF1544_06136 [Mucor circinelloides 1006PhL]|uniref:Uncharacterized protein n=1 Tax=Mucor circinelloides f. circinelloides (strain 1006PhL) TaxID=1220926 RepID=S2JF50_MUCC1|nr:hypothetical protein HMPREF1544_06136 [Mucor circinelloides 1006PhL]